MSQGQTIVIAAVIRRDDAFLVCRRPLHKRHGGLWEFPGGKLEAGESLIEAAHRELQEELAVEVDRVGPVLFSNLDAGSPFLIQFTEVWIRGEPVAREHSELAWADLDALASLPLAPSDLRFAAWLRDRSVDRAST